MLDPRLNPPFRALRLAYGLVPIVAGLDKFTNLLTDWHKYLSPLVERMLPFSSTTFFHLIGLVEIVAGVVVLSRYVRLGAYIVTVWLLAIALDLITSGHFFDVAVRDIVMAVGAFALAKLAEVRAGASEKRARSPEPRLEHARAS